MQTLSYTNNVIDSPWLTCPKPQPQASLRLFCFPYAGGSATIYRTWATTLPASVEVCAVQLPGRGKRVSEPAFTRLPALIEALAEALVPYLKQRPFAFFGHSMGALISFELTRHLRRTHPQLVPQKLFLSGRRAPSVVNSDAPTADLPEAQFIETLHQLNGTPREVLEHPELMQLMLPLLRADFAVCETYEYKTEPPLACPLSVYGGLQDTEVTREQLEAWRTETSGAFSLRMFPGDHFYLNNSPDQLPRMLAQELSTRAR
jgi:medium-chain acyl-[acyl-carrier-protein] hydrolase